MAFTQSVSNPGYTSDDMNRRVIPVRNYLEGTDSSANYTAKEITTLAKDISSPGLNESQFSLEGFLCSLWAEMVDVIKEILTTIPGKIDWWRYWVQSKKYPDRSRLKWKSLRGIGAWLFGPWEEVPHGTVFTDGGYSSFSPNLWASLNAFTVRITAASLLNFEAYAIWILRHTLEVERVERMKEEVDDNLPAAAMWIIYAGQIVYRNAAKDYTPDSPESRPTHIRYLRTFTRDCAGEALGRMVEIERRYPEPKASEEPALRPSGMMTAFHAQSISGAE